MTPADVASFFGEAGLLFMILLVGTGAVAGLADVVSGSGSLENRDILQMLSQYVVLAIVWTAYVR